jgi:alpha-galactosidase
VIARITRIAHAARRRAHVAAFLAVALPVLLIAAAPAAPALAQTQVKRARAGSHRHHRAHAVQTPNGGLAQTPYMGWDTYFAFGGAYSESTVLRQASELITLGLRNEGFRYVWLDVGWWQGSRDGTGQISVSARQWPHGMAWLTHALHAAGLLAGIYTDAGRNGCGGARQGSGGHYRQDVNTFAAWGFDAIKLDFCGGSEEQLDPAAAYSAYHAAIASDSPRRPLLLSICNFLQPGQYGEGRPTLGESAFASYTFGPSVGNSWRTDTDVGFPGKVPFEDVLRNMDADAAAPQAAGPGHWNDPDYLAPDQGMSAAQFRSQLSMWSILAAPLMVSDDLTRASSSSTGALTNGEVIAIDQDPAGVQGRLVASTGSGQVWVKPLSGAARAVALLNRSSTPTKITTSARAIGMPPGGGYVLRDVWTHTTRVSANSISATVGGDSTVLLRVSQTA